jgi:hypothetical protein
VTSEEEAILQAQKVKDRYEPQLLKKANVVSIGIGYRERQGKLTDEIVLVVNVAAKIPRSQLATDDVIPGIIEGVPVDVREVGRMKAW